MPFQSLPRDFRYAARSLRARPGFTAAVVLTLALGIGANAAMFSVVDRLLFRPPPKLIDPATAHRVYFGATNDRGAIHAPRKDVLNSSVQFARYADLTRWAHDASRTAIFAERPLAVGVGQASREMPIAIVSASFFGFFDAPPALGRYFTTREDAPPDGTPVVVLGQGYWQTQYGGRRDALGATIRIGPVLYTVIGVAPEGFAGLWPEQPPAAYIPISTYAADVARANPFLRKEGWNTTYHWSFASMIVRRRPGVSIADADADLTNAYVRSWEAERTAGDHMRPSALARPHVVLGSVLRERGPDESSVARVATWLGGVALIVLLVACANVGNLLLARALRRRREIAVRLAVGATAGRLLSQLLAESVLLALLGGVAGLIVARWGTSLLRAAFFSKDTASLAVLGDQRTVLFAAAIALGAGLLTGLAPVFQSRRADLTNDLKAGVREGTFRRSRTRAALLIVQGALSVLLLIGAGLFVRSLRHVRELRLGYDADRVLLVNRNMRGVMLDSAHTVALGRQLLAAATAIPGVEHASLQVAVPFWSTWEEDLFVAGIDSVRRLGDFRLNAVSPDYFATMGTRLLRGRAITDADVAGAPRAMVVSQSMAHTLWPGRDPIGQCVKVGADTVPCSYVVGVAEDIKASSLSKDDGLYYYLSAAQWPADDQGLFVRMHGDAAQSAELVRRALQRLMPGASYVTVTPLSEILGGETKAWRLGATMFLAFGLLALALAAIGLYSVLAYTVAQRTHELGVRVALGAQVRDVVRLVVGDGLRLGAIGVAIGALLALGAARWVQPLLFDESPRDPVVYGVVVGVLLIVAVVASVAPAVRAAGVDPNEALRSE